MIGYKKYSMCTRNKCHRLVVIGIVTLETNMKLFTLTRIGPIIVGKRMEKSIIF
jgi:hypothetical protein